VSPESIKQTRAIKTQLCDLAYQEVINYSFVAEKQLIDLGLDAHAFGLANPLNKEMAVMRTQLLPGMLANIKFNLARQEQDLAFFELGKVFSNDKEIIQDEQLLLAKTGLNKPEQWGLNSRKVDFFDIKGDVEMLLCEVVGQLDFVSSAHDWLHPGRQADVSVGGTVIGCIGQLHPSICQQMKIKQEVYVAQLELNPIQRIHLPEWQSVSKFPKVRRDLSIILGDEVTWDSIDKAVKNSLGSLSHLLVNLSLFDVYTGDNIENGYKSLAIAMIFQEKSRTLEDKEVDKLVSKAVSFLAEQFNAEVRT
jgi:phenylalanyl-tRNA synthetase beta chain